MADAIGKENVKVQIDTLSHTRIVGEVVVHGGYRGRLSDMLNDNRPFIAVNNADITTQDGKAQHAGFLCINKQAITAVIPLGD